MTSTMSADTDLIVRDGNLVIATGKQAIGERIRQRLLLARGEWFADFLAGLSHIPEILGVPYTQLTNRLIISEVEKVEGVLGVVDIFVINDPVTRNTQIAIRADTDDGSVEVVAGLPSG